MVTVAEVIEKLKELDPASNIVYAHVTRADVAEAVKFWNDKGDRMTLTPEEMDQVIEAMLEKNSLDDMFNEDELQIEVAKVWDAKTTD